MEIKVMSAGEFLDAAKARMESTRAMHHPFLQRFKTETLSMEQLRRFAIQWYKTARAHKLAFPALIYNIKDDDVRFELVEILFDEYGLGDRSKIHAKLLLRFLCALGVSEFDVDQEPTLPAVERFSDEVLRIWRDGDSVFAFGLHFALEFLAASIHSSFSDGLQKYPDFNSEQREYFDYHKVAEQNHSDYSEAGILIYARNVEKQALLDAGIQRGIELVEELWNGFLSRVLDGFDVSLAEPLGAVG